ncbi:penicillin-binding protein 1C [Rheinheimera salexigens]|uniref:peptidoglycan glycosyltransferase n=1 Tax=Rheinheimera salexigens TaxID=1628148 RepID=A0A1E7Q6S2_9GAMM|nr:penicillin-binding protein 1C [Rheinheimera salexigens]OEY69894.1 penicillin-binding protein 1C [Rheinheimera salexigens]
MASSKLLPARGKARLVKTKLIALLRLFGLIALLLALTAAISLWLSPKPDLYRNYQQASAYFAAEGELLSLRLANDQRYRLRITLNDIAPSLQQATLLYEDRNFYQHYGVDGSAILRAFWQSVIKDGRRQGASTISMQLARLRFNLRSNTWAGKLQQLAYALYLERHFSKTEILEGYFNYAPYAANIEGVAAASLVYFSKEAKYLTLPESLALAVMPQNPSQRNPETTTGQQQLELARQRLAQLWLQQQAKPANPANLSTPSKPIPLSTAQISRLEMPLHYQKRSNLPYAAPHFINYLAASTGQQGRFYTSLQLGVQQQVERLVQAYLLRQQSKGLENASVLLIKRSNLQVVSWLGSADFNNAAIHGQVDGVTALRSPGSALKPFIYALAMQQGIIHPQSLLIDLPRRYGGFNPENFDRQFVGPIHATAALINSRNLPAVHLQSQLQQPDFYQWLLQAGVNLPQPAEYYGLALALGGMEITMQQLVQLYASLGNQGQWGKVNWQAEASDENVESIGSIEGVENIKKTENMDNVANNKTHSVLSKEAAFLTLDMLRQHAKPQAALLTKLTSSTPVAWKTGTSYAFRDAWAVGLSGDYVLAVWLGNFNGDSNPNLVGRSAAGPLFFQILDLLDISPTTNKALFTATADLNLRQVPLCQRSGDLPNKYCPQTELGWFIPGVSPIKLSKVHRAVPVDIISGKRACFHQPGKTKLDVYEFWPSDVNRSFINAGIILRQPPDFGQACTGLSPVVSTMPAIRSPQADLVYQLGASAEQRKIALQASFDGDVSQAHWFANNRYLATVKPGETFFWTAQAGRYQLRVVDDLGGVDSRLIQLVDQ